MKKLIFIELVYFLFHFNSILEWVHFMNKSILNIMNYKNCYKSNIDFGWVSKITKIVRCPVRNCVYYWNSHLLLYFISIQARFLLSKVNPSTTHNNMSWGGVSLYIYISHALSHSLFHALWHSLFHALSNSLFHALSQSIFMLSQTHSFMYSQTHSFVLSQTHSFMLSYTSLSLILTFCSHTPSHIHSHRRRQAVMSLPMTSVCKCSWNTWRS